MNGYPMNIIKRLVVTISICAFIAILVLVSCQSNNSPLSSIETPQPAYAAAQSTLDYGQSQMNELSHQATVVSMNMDQAAKAAAQSTLDYNQRQLMELSIQETEVSLNMAQAAATQQFVAGQTQAVVNATADAQRQVEAATYSAYLLNVTQTARAQAILDANAAETAQAVQYYAELTQMAYDAAATAQSQDATATYSVYILNVTQTARAQAILDVQATHTAQANATQQAYSLTATPWAALQSDITRTRNESIRRSLWGEFVVTPLKVILSTLVIVLLIMGGVIAYRRLMPVLELRLRTIRRMNDSPLLLVDGMILDHDLPLPQIPSNISPQVEIIDPSEPSVANWIAEAEHKLRSDGRMPA